MSRSLSFCSDEFDSLRQRAMLALACSHLRTAPQ